MKKLISALFSLVLVLGAVSMLPASKVFASGHEGPCPDGGRCIQFSVQGAGASYWLNGGNALWFSDRSDLYFISALNGQGGYSCVDFYHSKSSSPFLTHCGAGTAYWLLTDDISNEYVYVRARNVSPCEGFVAQLNY